MHHLALDQRSQPPAVPCGLLDVAGLCASAISIGVWHPPGPELIPGPLSMRRPTFATCHPSSWLPRSPCIITTAALSSVGRLLWAEVEKKQQEIVRIVLSTRESGAALAAHFLHDILWVDNRPSVGGSALHPEKAARQRGEERVRCGRVDTRGAQRERLAHGGGVEQGLQHRVDEAGVAQV